MKFEHVEILPAVTLRILKWDTKPNLKKKMFIEVAFAIKLTQFSDVILISPYREESLAEVVKNQDYLSMAFW